MRMHACHPPPTATVHWHGRHISIDSLLGRTVGALLLDSRIASCNVQAGSAAPLAEPEARAELGLRCFDVVLCEYMQYAYAGTPMIRLKTYKSGPDVTVRLSHEPDGTQPSPQPVQLRC